MFIPIFIWNIALAHKFPKAFQPEIFWNKIPAFLTYGENISRVIIVTIALGMPLKVVTSLQKKGLFLYATGALLYFASWLLLIYVPDSQWSNTVWGFMAPAYTPLLWLLGMGMIGDAFYFKLPFKRWYFILAAIIFLGFHNLHTYLIFSRTH
ncbi:hypothetical protein [Rufibacter quisquiliarum]|uniref:Uncharacterized protein n=1 Tax=Rufibacter quisquiliarum TaxID=1549639 RepID=A0A839GW58_9BACT|nr:hypothetical protein [Rufibacter quisquiliarum]MBA9078658.1 hypothetical protein [Rufibacter quisquiliarum]